MAGKKKVKKVVDDQEIEVEVDLTALETYEAQGGGHEYVTRRELIELLKAAKE